MRRLSLLTVISAAMTLALWISGGTVHAEQIKTYKSGNWIINVYTNDHTKKFSACAGVMGYKSGITMAVNVGANYSWALMFFNQAWQLTPNQIIPLVVSFDDREPYTGNATATTSTFVVLPMADNSKLITDFRAAHLMKITTGGNVFAFYLNGTSQLLIELVGTIRLT